MHVIKLSLVDDVVDSDVNCKWENEYIMKMFLWKKLSATKYILEKIFSAIFFLLACWGDVIITSN